MRMATKLRSLGPSEAFDDTVGRAFAGAAVGFLVAGSLHAAGAFSESFLIVCAMESAFFGILTMSLAYYHARRRLGLLAVIFSALVPYLVNLLWIKFSDSSLVYPTVALVFLGGVTVEAAHRKISGPSAADAAMEEAIRDLIEEADSSLTWTDTVMWLCFAASAALLLVLLLR
jgi:uncharacterized membrane protein YoaK (UPF0700 family)